MDLSLTFWYKIFTYLVQNDNLLYQNVSDNQLEIKIVVIAHRHV